MIPHAHRLLATVALVVLAGCDPNPDGPRVPPDAAAKISTDGQPAPARRPVTKNRREIVNPE